MSNTENMTTSAPGAVNKDWCEGCTPDNCPGGCKLGDNLPPATFTSPKPTDEAPAKDAVWNVGDRVMWTCKYGRQFPATITAVEPARYDAKLDDGTSALAFEADRFTSQDSPT